MKIVVIGSGAIGGLVAGYLRAKGEDVVLIARAQAQEVISSSGLNISGVRGEYKIEIPAEKKLNFAPDLTVIATKTQDLEKALKDNLKFIKGSIVLTTQNGVAVDDIVAKFIPKENIVSSIVMFGSTNLEPGKIVHNFEGSWIIGRIFPECKVDLAALSAVLGKVFPFFLGNLIQFHASWKLFPTRLIVFSGQTNLVAPIKSAS